MLPGTFLRACYLLAASWAFPGAFLVAFPGAFPGAFLGAFPGAFLGAFPGAFGTFPSEEACPFCSLASEDTFPSGPCHWASRAYGLENL